MRAFWLSFTYRLANIVRADCNIWYFLTLKFVMVNRIFVQMHVLVKENYMKICNPKLISYA